MTFEKKFTRWLESVWYENNSTGFWLVPLGWLFSLISGIRRSLYRQGLFKIAHLSVPVVVIGNISVGGTGKTPLIIWMAGYLKRAGYKPGIISRGYGGQAEVWPQWVDADSNAEQVGDEALVIYRQAVCPMAVGPVRVETAQMVLEKTDCDVILSDDGMQHYGLGRDLEIAVVDGERRFGNGRCLPAGPLREPVSRLETVDLIICNGKSDKNEFSMQIEGDTAVNVKTNEPKPLTAFQRKVCHALAGIGNPRRFFNFLERNEIECDTRIFPDHHDYQQDDISFNDDNPVLMTEKDAVKCIKFAGKEHWYIPVKAVPDTKFSERLLKLLREKIDG